jgi:hypothetical protein
LSTLENLKSMNLPKDTMIRLSQEGGEQVDFRHEHSPVDIWNSSGMASELASWVATKGLDVFDDYGNNIFLNLREEGYLDEYDREGWFEEYISQVFSEHAYDLSLFDSNTEHYDYKRGYCTVTTTINVPLHQLFNTGTSISGWQASVKTPAGTLTLD